MSINGSDIEKAVEAALTASNKFAKVQVGVPIPSVSRPGVNVAVVEGDFERFGNRLKRTFNVSVLLVVKNVVSESERRSKVHPLQDFVVRLLWDNSLGIQTSGLIPGKWREITSAVQLKDGLTVFECLFTTSSTFEKEPSDEDLVALDEIFASYTIQPGDSEADASDSVDLRES